MLAALAIFTFTAVTFAQAKPAPPKKEKTETTKKAVAHNKHKKATTAKAHPKAAPAKKTEVKKS